MYVFHRSLVSATSTFPAPLDFFKDAMLDYSTLLTEVEHRLDCCLFDVPWNDEVLFEFISPLVGACNFLRDVVSNKIF